jgi:hypothetical protein
MKNEPIRYLGLDVHRSTVVASVRDEQGKVVMKATVATEEKGARGRGHTFHLRWGRPRGSEERSYDPIYPIAIYPIAFP